MSIVQVASFFCLETPPFFFTARIMGLEGRFYNILDKKIKWKFLINKDLATMIALRMGLGLDGITRQ